VNNTKIYFPTPIDLVQKDTGKLPYLSTVLGSLSMRFRVLSEQRSCEVVACSFNKEQAVCELHAGTQRETHPYHSGSSCGCYSDEVSIAIRCVAYPVIVAKRQCLVLALFIYVILR
jgi:hypothetical protein